MKRKLLLSLCALLPLPALAGDIKGGEWEYTVEMQMPGMPQVKEMPKMPEGMKLPPGLQFGPKGMVHTFKNCISDDDPVPKNDQQGPHKCEITKQERSGSTIKWASHCTTPDGEMDAEGSATYTGDSMTSEMHAKGTQRGKPVEMTQKMTGRRLGACPVK